MGEETVRAERITVHNVLAHAELNTGVELRKAVRVLQRAEFDPDKFQAVRVRFWRENALVSVFGTGKIQATGCRSVEDARRCMKRVARRLKKEGGEAGEKIRFSGFRTENVLATFDAEFPINLLALSADPAIVCMYDPTRFAAAVVRDLDDTRATIDVFASGKINIKAPGGMKLMLKALKKAMPTIVKHRARDD